MLPIHYIIIFMKKNVLILISFLITVVVTYSFIFVSFAYEGKIKMQAGTMFTKVLGEHSSNQKLLSPISGTLSITTVPIATVSGALPSEPTASGSGSSIMFHNSWPIQSVSSMKITKDIICTPQSETFISKWIDTAKELGVNYISIETPYDNPPCGNALAYTKLWVSIIRSRGLHVWHRHMFTSFEGIYSAPKDPNKNYLQMISDYIKANPDIFAPDDIFSPSPEPQNGGIKGVTGCSQDICIFTSAKEFNLWLRNAMDVSNAAFQYIGLGGKIKVGYFGFDGFVAWGNNNPQWSGILEKETIQKMGNITIDHYPEAVGDTMAEDLNKLQKKYPNLPIVIGEWGTIIQGNEVKQVINSMQAAKRKNIIGFNYWQLGMGGNEELIYDDFSHKSTFEAEE